MIGNIPANLKLFVCDPTTINVNYDDSDIQITKSFTASETFVSDAINEKTCKTGENWAEDKCKRWDSTISKYIDGNYKIETIPNTPIKNVRITSLEHRGQGGRAYKVIVNDLYYVDLREDVLLDTILHVGIDANGKLRGEYIFAKVGSQMKLIRVNSALHNALIEATALKQVSKIKNIKVGRVYETLKRDKFVFLGNVTTTEVTLNEPDRSYRAFSQPVTGTLSTKQVTGMLFYKFASFEKDTTSVEIIPYKFEIKKAHTLRVDTGIDANIPLDWLVKLKDTVYQEAVDRGNKYANVKNSKFNEIYYMNSLLANIGEMHPAYVRALAL